MSWLAELAGSLIGFGAGGGGTTVQASQQQATNVSVNPTIINAIDATPIGRELAAPVAQLAEAVAVGAAAQVKATQDGNAQLAAAVAGRNQQLDQIFQFVSLATLGLGVLRFMGAFK